MKTYEEMARDVLRRRDEELTSVTQTSQLNAPPEMVYPGEMKKRSWIPKIAIPCAAAVLVGVVGISVWKNVRGNHNPNQTPGIAAADEEGEYIFQDFVREQPESIYKGGKTKININEAEEWNVYHLPALLEEDFRSIDDDKINNYYGFEFDRLSRVFPEWESEHEPFGTYAHDEDDSFVVSHRIIHTTNVIHYTNDISLLAVAASITPRYDSATVENAKPSVINGFDAMVYSRIGELDEMQYAADIEMGIAQVQIHAVNVSEEEFLNILDVYTAADESGEDDDQNQNHNQTMEDKIVVYNGRPDFIMEGIPYELPYTDYSGTVGVGWLRYSEEQLNALYGLNFMCFSELHPDWKKFYDELSFGVNYKGDDQAIGGDIPQNREIVGTRNWLSYSTSEGDPVVIIAMKGEFPETDIEHSVVNGYDAVIFLAEEDGQYDYGAVIDMDGTLICITNEGNISENDFVDLLREYTSEASKYDKSANPPEPTEFATFSAVDFVDDRITYDVSWDAQSSWWKLNYSEDFDVPHGKIEYSDTTLVYLRDFFGTNKLPVDYRYQNNFEREMNNGTFNCSTAEGAMAYSPVDGKVVGACEGWYNRGLGNAVAVEFGDGKIFIIGHLDEVNVEVGDTVTAGQILGVCGRSGLVYFGDPPKLSLIIMQKVD